MVSESNIYYYRDRVVELEAELARVRDEERRNAVRIVSGAYVVDSHGALEDSSWNTAISVALEYLREEYA